eukprot:g21854.t1
MHFPEFSTFSSCLGQLRLMWNSILQFTLRHHADDGTKPSSFTEMDPKRREFLITAMEGLVIDETQKMKEILAICQMPESEEEIKALLSKEDGPALPSIKELSKTNPSMPIFKYVQDSKQGTETKQTTADQKDDAGEKGPSSPAGMGAPSLSGMVRATKETALEELEEVVGRIDAANDLAKMNGISILLSLFNTTRHTSIRSRVLSALATCLQNNPEFQHKLNSEHKPLDLLLPLLSSSGQVDASLQNKALLALSALLRDNPAGLTQFYAHEKGLQTLLALGCAAVTSEPARPGQTPPATEQVRVSRKALFVLDYLLKPELCPSNTRHQLRPQAARLLRSIIGHPDIDLRENALRVVLRLLAPPRTIRVLSAFSEEETGWRNILRNRLNQLLQLKTQEDKDQASVEVGLVAAALKALNSPPEPEPAGPAPGDAEPLLLLCAPACPPEPDMAGPANGPIRISVNNNRNNSNNYDRTDRNDRTGQQGAATAEAAEASSSNHSSSEGKRKKKKRKKAKK